MKLLDIKEKIWLLDDENFNFPTLEQMGGDLVAIGGDFHPQRLLNAYENGLFPWFIDDYNYINWYSPQKRMILYPNDLKVSKSLKKSIKNRGFEIKSNTNFENVIKNCQKVKRKHENDTWIDDNFIKLNWTISKEVTTNPGKILIQIDAEDTDFEWKTVPQIFYIIESINASIK